MQDIFDMYMYTYIYIYIYDNRNCGTQKARNKQCRNSEIHLRHMEKLSSFFNILEVSPPDFHLLYFRGKCSFLQDFQLVHIFGRQEKSVGRLMCDWSIE